MFSKKFIFKITKIATVILLSVNSIQAADKRSFEEFEKSAESGDVRSQFTLCFAYYFGKISALPQIDIKPNLETAFSWCEKSAKQGFAPSQYSLGNMYEKGRGVEKDLVKAVEWYEKAAVQGNTNAKKKFREIT